MQLEPPLDGEEEKEDQKEGRDQAKAKKGAENEEEQDPVLPGQKEKEKEKHKGDQGKRKEEEKESESSFLLEAFFLLFGEADVLHGSILSFRGAKKTPGRGFLPGERKSFYSPAAR